MIAVVRKYIVVRQLVSSGGFNVVASPISEKGEKEKDRERGRERERKRKKKNEQIR